ILCLYFCGPPWLRNFYPRLKDIPRAVPPSLMKIVLTGSPSSSMGRSSPWDRDPPLRYCHYKG
ncbi:MAG TPA: hypothetical protein VE844_15335, partial [Gammaproteobacteria bacterium]|nr:hypothetical protein [Gammaproteobacteria bacterium]